MPGNQVSAKYEKMSASCCAAAARGTQKTAQESSLSMVKKDHHDCDAATAVEKRNWARQKAVFVE
jgi:hypothetical protein